MSLPYPNLIKSDKIRKKKTTVTKDKRGIRGIRSKQGNIFNLVTKATMVTSILIMSVTTTIIIKARTLVTLESKVLVVVSV